ncbi:hypothetical protein MTR_4g035695 [Medicago truncatula]|uniref:Uncharacterized protein n=1 Tax=Medicago truncatula TaxID=3880 RepID=A0A072UJU6_MEDTR|nr:hypothetical protein MTR_4g035695 [Medicago truncatula]
MHNLDWNPGIERQIFARPVFPLLRVLPVRMRSLLFGRITCGKKVPETRTYDWLSLSFSFQEISPARSKNHSYQCISKADPERESSSFARMGITAALTLLQGSRLNALLCEGKAGTAHARHKRQGTFNRHGRPPRVNVGNRLPFDGHEKGSARLSYMSPKAKGLLSFLISLMRL